MQAEYAQQGPRPARTRSVYKQWMESFKGPKQDVVTRYMAKAITQRLFVSTIQNETVILNLQNKMISQVCHDNRFLMANDMMRDTFTNVELMRSFEIFIRP